MATRKPNRRPVAPHSPHQRRHHAPHNQPPPSKSQHYAPLSFVGVSDDALNVVLAAMLAKPVTITAVNGAVYTGLFGGTERVPPKQALHLLLRYGTVSSPASSKSSSASPPPVIVEQRGSTARKILVPIPSVAALRTEPLDFSTVAPASRPNSEPARASRGFATDGDISRGATGAGRQLKRFEHFSDINSSTGSNPSAVTLDEQTFGDLATPGAHPKGDWDQFQVNEAKFGVTTTFDENEYTTRIDRGGADFEQRLRHAARLASEIKADATATDNPHLREERGLVPDDSLDEEDRYSTVNRSATATRVLTQSQTQRDPTSDSTTDRPTRSAPPERPKLSYAAAAAAANARSAPTSTALATTNLAHHSAHKSTPLAKSQSTTTKPKIAQTKQQYTTARPQAQTKPAQQAQKSASVKSTSNGSKPSSTNKPVAQQPQQGHSNKITPNSAKSPPVPEVPTNITSQSAPIADPAPKATPSTKTSGVNLAKDFETDKVKSGRERSGRENLPQIMKVRNSHTSRSSPNQTRNSPLPTAGTADTQAVAVLNLDAHTPNLGPEKIKKFEEYKTNMEIQSIADNREKITDDLKKFSTQLDSRNGPLRRGQNLPTNVSSSSLASNVTTVTNEAGGDQAADAGKSSDESKKGKLSESEDQAPAKAEDNQEVTEAASTAKKEKDGSDSKPKARPKSRLNPNAAEFKMNPNAPTFRPGPQVAPMQQRQPQPPQAQQQQQQQGAYNTYVPNNGPQEFSQAMPSMPQGYPIAMHVGQMPYGQPYAMMVPAVPANLPGARGGQVYMQGAPVTFPGGQVPTRFPQSVGMPVSYGYPQVAPMVLPPQRIHPGPPPYPQVYNHPSFPAGQAGGSPMSPPMQQPVYPAPPPPGGPVHVQGPAVAMNGRSGHNNARRGGGIGRPRGRHHGHNAHHNGQNNNQGTAQGQGGGNAHQDRSGGRPPEANATSDAAGQR